MEQSNIFTEIKQSGWVLQAQCFPKCQASNSSLMNKNDVIGGYNPCTNEITIIHRFSNDIWTFNPDTLQYSTIIPSGIPPDLSTLISPLYSTSNDTLYIWQALLDPGRGMIGYNMTSHTYFDPQFYRYNSDIKIFNNDDTKCMVTDGNCLLLIFADDTTNPRIYHLNLCDTPGWQTGRTVVEPLGRVEFSCIIRDDKLYFIGGGTKDGENIQFHDPDPQIRYINITRIKRCVYDLDCPNSEASIPFDLETEIDAYDLNEGRFSAETIIFDDSILIIGGYDGAGFKTNSEIMDFRLRTTLLVTENELSLPHARSLLVLANKDNKPTIFLFGGFNDETGAATQCVVEYSIGLTNAPTKAPTNAPTFSPTIAPTDSPTASPTEAPTQSPTPAPTNAPTESPTRFPTTLDNSRWEAFVEGYIVISGFNSDMVNQFNDMSMCKTYYNRIAKCIEQGYQESGDIEYANFDVLLTYINNIRIPISEKHRLPELDSNPGKCEEIGNKLKSNNYVMSLQIKVDTDSSDIATTIYRRYNNIDNTKSIEMNTKTSQCLNDEFNSNDFGLVSMKLEDPESYLTIWKEYGLIIVCAVFGFMLAIVGFLAFLWNKEKCCCKIPGFHRMDSGNVVALANFGLQVYDLVTDCALAVDIAKTAQKANIYDRAFTPIASSKDNILYVCVLGSIIFVVFPYFCNIFAATQIKEKIKTNHMALAWFQGYTSIYVILTVLTGSCYVALQLVSSSLFGLLLLRSGITRYELNELSSLKIFLTVVFENIPQFIIQMLYLYYKLDDGDLKDVSIVQWLSIISSVLSVISAVLTYMLYRKIVGVDVIHYYVEIAIKDTYMHSKGYLSPHFNNNLLSPQSPKAPLVTKAGSSGNINIRDPDLTEEERIFVFENIGLKQKISLTLAGIFNIPKQNIECGESILKSDGIVMHIIQFVSHDDRKNYFDERKKSKYGKNLKYNKNVIKISGIDDDNAIKHETDDDNELEIFNNDDNDDDINDTTIITQIPKTYEYIKLIWNNKKNKSKIKRQVVGGILELNKKHFDVKMHRNFEALHVDMDMIKKGSYMTTPKMTPKNSKNT